MDEILRKYLQDGLLKLSVGNLSSIRMPSVMFPVTSYGKVHQWNNIGHVNTGQYPPGDH